MLSLELKGPVRDDILDYARFIFKLKLVLMIEHSLFHYNI